MSSRICRNLRGVAAWLAVITIFGVLGIGTSVDARGPRELLDEAQRLYETRQVDRAEARFREALRLAESGGLAREQGEALLGLGRIEIESDLRTAAKQDFDRAMAKFEAAGDRIGYAQALAASGQARVLLGDAAEGVRRVQTAVDALRGRGDGTQVDGTQVDGARADGTRADGARADGLRGDGLRGGERPKRGARWDAAGTDVEALARASAILMSVMPPGPDKDRARDAVLAAARASSSRGHECAIRHAWGGDLLRAGEYAEAWRMLTDAVTCYEGVPNDRRLSNALVSLGSLKRTHGQFDAALAAFERAVTIGRERHDPVGTVVALNAVATAQTDLWRVDEARTSLEAALKLARERKMETLTAYTVGQLGAHLTQIEQFAAAIPLLEESLAQAVTAPRRIERLTQLCAARARAAGVGREGARAALPVCDRNVTLARGDSPTALLYALRARAEARRRAGEVEAASADLREAVELVEDLRSKTVPIDFMKRGFSAWHEWLFGSSIAVSVQQRDVRQALETAERARARAFLDLLATREVAAPPPTALASAAPGAGAPTKEPADRATLTARASGAPLNPRGEGSALSAVSRRTGGDPPRLDSSEAVRAATVPDMIATARRLQSTLLVYWMTPDAVYIWTIAPDGAVHDARVDVPMAKVAGLVAATRAAASQDPAAGLFALKASSSRRPWRELHDLLIAPVRAYLPNTPDALITIVPHGPLAQLSFAALQDEHGSYLLERYTLHYTPAVGVLAYTARRQEERRQQADSAGARPDPSEIDRRPHAQPRERAGHARSVAARDASAARDSAARERDTHASTLAIGDASDARSALLVGDPGELPGGPDGAPLSALPWARREVTEVASLLGGRATVLTDADASEAAVRDHLSGRSILHFATHGIVREDETLGSFLALRGDGQTDGRLTADEVYELKLDADLVVLSACSSALGPTGSEGIIGFTRAFLYAGAASVIATSWNVPDASSYELMHRFYRARRELPATAAGRTAAAAPAISTARALRAAQLSTLAALRQGKVTVTTPGDLNGRGTTVALPDHPLFWAGFIVVGEP
jgi:CHAT domain-containing protein/tetratricopeptide (TPR) repeat protein